jgi:polysaccharide deacetylase family protein (PEP-CTERM system associated)
MATTPSVILSFDVEEHDRIEAAAGLACTRSQKSHYAERMEICTRWIMDELAAADIQATFFVVGQIGRTHRGLVRDLHNAGHEIASHGWDHQRVHSFNSKTFRLDLRRSKFALEDLIGARVIGYRAPTFSIMRETAWAVDVLAEEGFLYDSSVFPIRHDRYGVPRAPRQPFVVRGLRNELLELPPATLSWLGHNLPAAGGGYFRLFPLGIMRAAIRQLQHGAEPGVAMLYFHPWEFDPEQERLPLKLLSRWRTYVGIGRTRGRLRKLLQRYSFRRAADVAREIRGGGMLRDFALAG